MMESTDNLRIPWCDNICQGKYSVDVFCNQCCMSYCKICFDTHVQLKAFKHHTSKPWDITIKNSMPPPNCDQHPQFPLNIMCLQQDCCKKNTLLCLMCAQYGPDHAGHKSDTITNVAEVYRGYLADEGESLKKLVNESLVATTKVEEVIFQLRQDETNVLKSSNGKAALSSEDKLIEEIKIERDRAISAINQNTNNFIQKVKNVTTERVGALKVQHKVLTDFVKSSYPIMQESEKLLSSNTDVYDFVENYKDVHNKIIEVSRMERTLNPLFTGTLSSTYDLRVIDDFMTEFEIVQQKVEPIYGKSIMDMSTDTKQLFMISPQLTLSEKKLSLRLPSCVRNEYHGLLSSNILSSINKNIISFKCELKASQFVDEIGDAQCLIGWGTECTNVKLLNEILGIHISQYEIFYSVNIGRFRTSKIVTDHKRKSITLCWIQTVETTYDIEKGTIHFKLTDSDNNVIINKLIHSEVPNTVSLYPCVYLYKKSNLYDFIACFDTPITHL